MRVCAQSRSARHGRQRGGAADPRSGHDAPLGGLRCACWRRAKRRLAAGRYPPLSSLDATFAGASDGAVAAYVEEFEGTLNLPDQVEGNARIARGRL